MNTEELKDKLKELNIEDFIWIIYIGIIFFSWYSNSLERDYFTTGNKTSKEKYRTIMIIIFSILVIVYLYFFLDSLEDFYNLKETDTKKKKELITLSFIASTLILISGLIFLYIAYKDEDLNVELAFN
jgi:amino acid transporter